MALGVLGLDRAEPEPYTQRLQNPLIQVYTLNLIRVPIIT